MSLAPERADGPAPRPTRAPHVHACLSANRSRHGCVCGCEPLAADRHHHRIAVGAAIVERSDGSGGYSGAWCCLVGAKISSNRSRPRARSQAVNATRVMVLASTFLEGWPRGRSRDDMMAEAVTCAALHGVYAARSEGGARHGVAVTSGCRDGKPRSDMPAEPVRRPRDGDPLCTPCHPRTAHRPAGMRVSPRAVHARGLQHGGVRCVRYTASIHPPRADAGLRVQCVGGDRLKRAAAVPVAGGPVDARGWCGVLRHAAVRTVAGEEALAELLLFFASAPPGSPLVQKRIEVMRRRVPICTILSSGEWSAVSSRPPCQPPSPNTACGHPVSSVRRVRGGAGVATTCGPQGALNLSAHGGMSCVRGAGVARPQLWPVRVRAPPAPGVRAWPVQRARLQG